MEEEGERERQREGEGGKGEIKIINLYAGKESVWPEKFRLHRRANFACRARNECRAEFKLASSIKSPHLPTWQMFLQFNFKSLQA